MTFSLIGRCERTGMFGIAISTGEMAVGSRCIHVAPNVGAVISQASSNPRLGHLGLALLRQGYPAARVVEEIAASDAFAERRQLGCIDVTGFSAGRTGAANRPWAGHRAERNVVAAGNILVGAGVVEAMFETFQRDPLLPLWERLLQALEAGKAAGGEVNGEKSGGLYVVDREPYAVVDLRVDLHPEPVAELRRMARDYFPLIPYYRRRPLDPNVPPAAEWLLAERRRAASGDTLLESPETQPEEGRMPEERKGAVTLRGNPVTLAGPEIKAGQKAPAFTAVDNGLQPVKLGDGGGKVLILSSVPSLDTPVCDTETRRFNQEASQLSGAEIWTISADLPFAQKRWCASAGVSAVKTLSTFRDKSFGESYGVLITDGPLAGLNARAVFVVDKGGTIRHVEYVKDITQEPNYEAALGAAKQAAGS